MWPMMVSEVGRRMRGSASSPAADGNYGQSGKILRVMLFFFDKAFRDEQRNATFWWPVA